MQNAIENRGEKERDQSRIRREIKTQYTFAQTGRHNGCIYTGGRQYLK